LQKQKLISWITGPFLRQLNNHIIDNIIARNAPYYSVQNVSEGVH
jgi:hypothetical protein